MPQALQLHVDAQFIGPFAMSAFVALEEMGLACELLTVDLDAGAQAAPGPARGAPDAGLAPLRPDADPPGAPRRAEMGGPFPVAAVVGRPGSFFPCLISQYTLR